MKCSKCPYLHVVDEPNSSNSHMCCTVDYDHWRPLDDTGKCVQPEKLRSAFYKLFNERIKEWLADVDNVK